MTAPARANRLAHESSPYLRQHADNPVDWYPWGEEALALARRLDRPIFLSVGYSACHWCHVMEHESFEDAEVARVLNENFVSIKVDREERPDVDQVYMTAVQMLTGQGGWPMSVFLTPELEPFYGGTYFPPDDRYGRPSFRRVLLAVMEAWRERRDEVGRSAGQITEQLRRASGVPGGPGELDVGLIRGAVAGLRRAFDPVYGGFGSAPKFPHPMDVRLLLRAWQRFGDDEALGMVRVTLDRMAAGGIYDHLGGGFHRYSTDERWLVPHFEKMLYDNALLSMAYLEAYQATGEGLYREVVEETLAYVLREMTGPEGAFCSTQDADSEGEEGKFYVWSARQLEEVLGKELADVMGEVYGVSPEGNWEGYNILHRTRTLGQTARLRGVDEAELRVRVAEGRRRLLGVRNRRVWPGRDEKVLTAWNGLMIGALAAAGRVLEEGRYTDAAVRAADFVLTRMRREGRLLRTYSSGTGPKLNGYLEDYAFLIEALVALYEATFEPRWVARGLEVARTMIEQFWDPTEGGFFFTGKDHEALITRSKDRQDGSVPSGNSMAATGLLRLAKLTGVNDLWEKGEATLRAFGGLMAQAPAAAGQMLVALDFWLGPVQEIAVVGRAGAEDTRRVLRAIFGTFRPRKVVAFNSGEGGEGPAGLGGAALGEKEKIVPLLAGRKGAERVITYICQDFVCRTPLEGAEAVEAALASAQTGMHVPPGGTSAQTPKSVPTAGPSA